MDFVEWKRKVSGFAHRYKYAVIVLLLGILLMLIPGKSEEEKLAAMIPQEAMQNQSTVEERLAEILAEVAGAGAVKVMLTEAQGEQTVYQTDTTYSQTEHGTDTRTQTILTTDSGRNQEGLIHQRNPPKYQGAIVLAQGAENPAVKLAIVEAVSNVTGLGADRISVLKMQ